VSEFDDNHGGVVKPHLSPTSIAMARAILYIVRHGETDENKQKIFQGQLDTVLNAHGVEQAERVACALRSISFDVAFSSDLSRAVKVESSFVLIRSFVLG
jgi:broad specificity phosphatase PhoE